MNYREIFIARIKLLCRRRKIIILSLLLPLFVMGIIHFMTAALPDKDDVNSIELGVVTDNASMVQGSFLSEKEFHLVYGSKEKMELLLLEKKIDAYITIGDKIELYIDDMGLKQSMIKGYLDSDVQRAGSSNAGVNEGSLDSKEDNLIVSMTEPIALPDKEILAFLYLTTLLCILGARWGFEEMKELVPNHSAIGKKLAFSPVTGWRILLLHFICVYVLQTACIFVFSFIILNSIGRDLQIRQELYFITVVLGSFSGILTGLLVGTIKRVNLKVKDTVLNIILAVMILAAFFTPAASRYFITNKLPFIKLINPPSLITGMLYCITIQDGFLIFLKDGLLLLLYILLITVWLFVRFKRQEE